MERTAVAAASARAANDYRYASAPTIAAFRCEIRDLIEGARDKVGKLHFCDRPHSHQCCADCGSDNSRFRNRRVHDARLAEFFEHALRDFECAAVDSDVLTQHKDTIVAL